MPTSTIQTQTQVEMQETMPMASKAVELFSTGMRNRQMYQGLQLLSSGLNTLSTFANRSNVASQNRQLDMQGTLLDANLANQESVLYDNFKRGISDLEVMTAAKNVDIRSQGVQADVVSSGIQMGEDLAGAREQNKLQKMAIELQKKVNKRNQKTAELGSLLNFSVNALMLAGV